MFVFGSQFLLTFWPDNTRETTLEIGRKNWFCVVIKTNDPYAESFLIINLFGDAISTER
jgi:hypothetical protein